MRPRAFTLFVAVLVILDITLHTGLGLGGLAPDLITVAVLLVARRTTAPKVVSLAIVLGLIDGAVAVGNLGGRSLGLGVAALLGTSTRQVVEGEGPLFIVPYLFLGKWLADAVVLLVRPAAGPVHGLWLELVTSVPISAVWSAVAGTVALAIFRITAGRDA